ncbi:hypothetical protein BH11PLA1_BH11PLA1_10190 [soil metagenome]
MVPGSLHALVFQLIDFAGLFPPTKLDMRRAVETYARHRASPTSFGLSRFVVTCSRLDEFSEAAVRELAVLPSAADDAPPNPWPVTVLIDGKLEENLQTIERFNHAHESATGHGHNHAHNAVVDTVEIKITTPDTIDYALDHLPEELYPFFEIPIAGDVRGFATALAGRGAGAKIRTGGITADLIPSVEVVAEFLTAFNAAEVPVKATAGLHHPVRSEHALTYDENAPRAVMHGFMNFFLAATMLHAKKLKPQQLIELLRETSPDAFRFADEMAVWRDKVITTDEIREAREDFAICFGSCSYDEPLSDLKSLKLLAPAHA